MESIEENLEWSTTLQKIEIDGRFSRVCVSNNLEITIKCEEKQILSYEDGKLVNIESIIAPPFPAPHLLLENIISFEQIDFDLLRSTFQDFALCVSLTEEISYQAKKGGQGPLYISIDVTLTPQKISGESYFTMEGDIETCCICLEESRELSQLQSCPHFFHDDCICHWLCESTTCPLCSTVIEIDF